MPPRSAALLTILVVLIMSAMLLFVVPQFESIYAQLGGTLPLPTRILLNMSRAMRSYWYIAIGGTIGFVVFFRRYKKTDRGRAQVDALKLKVPVFGQLFHKTALSRFSSTLGMLLRGGITIVNALEMVSGLLQPGHHMAADETSAAGHEACVHPTRPHALFGT